MAAAYIRVFSSVSGLVKIVCSISKPSLDTNASVFAAKQHKFDKTPNAESTTSFYLKIKDD